ncbi:MAG: hypothetical protein H0X51_05070 [Parachlamydiaceae bacterium]|nr:hypothetical protein [Parachlamydiaceae bacterium]
MGSCERIANSFDEIGNSFAFRATLGNERGAIVTTALSTALTIVDAAATLAAPGVNITAFIVSAAVGIIFSLLSRTVGKADESQGFNSVMSVIMGTPSLATQVAGVVFSGAFAGFRTGFMIAHSGYMAKQILS